VYSGEESIREPGTNSVSPLEYSRKPSCNPFQLKLTPRVRRSIGRAVTPKSNPGPDRNGMIYASYSQGSRSGFAQQAIVSAQQICRDAHRIGDSE
jgi:hypothetical protein